MQSQQYAWSRKNLKTNVIEHSIVQGALRPIQLWEYVVPKGSIPDVLTNMRIANVIDDIPSTDPSVPNVHPNPVNPNLAYADKYLWLFRKAAKLQPFPKLELKKNYNFITRPLFVEGVTITPIGYKDDKIDANEVLGYEQEML